MADIVKAVVKNHIDTAAQLAIDNITPLEGEITIESDSLRIKIGDGTTAYNSLEYAFGEVGEKKTFFTFKDRSSKRLAPVTYSNAVSTTGTYAALYAEVGDMFEQSHLNAGDSASGAGFFYPTPAPSGYGRSGIPDITFSNTDVSANLLNFATPSGFRDGTIFRYELLTGTTITNLVDGTEYYLRRVSSSTLSIHTTEANAIDNTSPIAIVDSGAGTFRLTQEGISISDAFQGHWHDYFYTANALGGPGSGGRADGNITGPSVHDNVKDAVTDEVNGISRTTNETRPGTYYQFAYIRY